MAQVVIRDLRRLYDVDGPSLTDGKFAGWQGGKLRGVDLPAPDITLATADQRYAPIQHLHDLDEITGLQAALDTKAAIDHTHPISDVTGLQTALNGKSNVGHGHQLADTAGLQGELDARELAANKGQPDGYAPLDAAGLLPSSVLPPLALTDVFVATSDAQMLALDVQRGDVVIRSDTSRSYVRNANTTGTIADFNELLGPAAPVQSVNGQTGVVNLAATDVGAATPAYVDSTAAGLVTLAPGTSARNLIQPSAGAKALVLRAPAGAPVNTFEVQDAAGSVVESIDSLGVWTSVQPATNVALRSLLLAGDAQPAFSVRGDGLQQWGPGGATAPDVQLSRTAAGAVRYQGVGGATGTLFTVRGVAAQTSGIFQVEDSTGANVFNVQNPTNPRVNIGAIDQVNISRSGTLYFPNASNVGTLISSVSATGGWWWQGGGANRMTLGASGNLAVLSQSPSSTPLTVKLAAAATADAVQIQDSVGTNITRVQPSGRVYMSGDGIKFDLAGNVFLDKTNATGSLFLNSTGGAVILQSASVSRLQVADEVRIGNIAVSAGSGASLSVTARSTTGPTLGVKGMAAQTGPLQELQDSTGAVLARFNAAGQLGIKGAAAPAALAGYGYIYVDAGGALRYRGPTTDTQLAAA